MGSSSKKPKTIPTERTYLANPITEYRSQAGEYPSNAEMWWVYRRPLEVGTDRPPKNYLEVFDPSLRSQISTGNSPAPKGHYILNAFDMDRSAVSGVGGIKRSTSGNYRPTAVAFYAGRVFYAGVNVYGFNTKIYFTQVLERPEQVQYCHQALDPTGEDYRDLLPTDGGVVSIPEIAEVYHMQAMGQSLFIFARNGVWALAGSEGVGFRANDFAINKVGTVPTISSMSFVSVEGAPLWWNKSGIHTLIMDQLGSAKAQSLTEETIKAFFDDIPTESKYYAKGAYDPLKQRVQWLYRRNPEGDPWVYDSILNLDTRTGAFYPFDLNGRDRVEALGLFASEGVSVVEELHDVLVDEAVVLVDEEPVETFVQLRKQVQSRIKYIVNVKEGDLPPPPEDEEWL